MGALIALLTVGVVHAERPASGGRQLARLIMENHIAGRLMELNLTPAQREELRVALLEVRAVREDAIEQAIPLLAKRRDALLAGDRESVRAADHELGALRVESGKRAKKALSNFYAELTERQQGILRDLLASRPMTRFMERVPGQDNLHRRPPQLRRGEREDGPAPRHEMKVRRPFATQKIQRSERMHRMEVPMMGMNLHRIDLLIELLERSDPS